LFFRLFPDLADIDSEFWPLMMQVLPIVHRIRGNQDLIALLCEFFFKMPARVKNLRYYTTVKNDTSSNKLGGVYIGENFVIGNYFPDYSPELELEFGPMAKREAVKFLPDGSFYKIIEFVKKYLLPFDSALKLNYVFHENQKGLYLQDSENADRIGLTSYI
jgi:predicted component of type VI protein secretion system